MEIQSPDTRENTIVTQKVEFFIRLLVLAVGLVLLSRNLDTQFVGWREDNNALYSSFARNHIYYGLGYTKLFQTYGVTQAPPAKPQRYLNHPPLLPLWVAMATSVFGDHEWVVRSVPIAATLGSAWLLMVIIGRLQSQTLGVLTGLFYVMLPITAYFGRVLNHDSPVQLFSLLALHGYLQWTGLYGNSYSRKAGAAYYVLAVVMGTGTGWAAIIMAGLIWLWHLCRVFRDRSLVRFLPLLTAIPAVSLAAVIIHILWGAQWDIGRLGTLFLSRTAGPAETTAWAEWLRLNRLYLAFNVSLFGIGAAIFYLAVIPAVLRYAASDSPFRQIVRDGTSVIPVLLTGLQGLIWVVVFRHQSGMHAYWQYHISPFVAVAMAAAVLTIFILLSKYAPTAAVYVTILIILMPIPFFARSLDILYKFKPHYENVESAAAVFKKLAQIVPFRVPVMTSEEFTLRPGSGEIVPQVTYYANRPLVYTTDINEIEANRQNCAAYILRATNDPNTYQFAQKLSEKYRLIGTERDYVIFLLRGQPKSN